MSLVTLKMEEICSSETSVLARATRRHSPEDNILPNNMLSPNRRMLYDLGSTAIQTLARVPDEIGRDLKGRGTGTDICLTELRTIMRVR
jgi:hypothetical protein